MLFFAWIDYHPAHYGDYYFPAWADGLGWLMSLCSVIFIPILAIYQLCKEDGSFMEVGTIYYIGLHWSLYGVWVIDQT